MNVGVYVDGFNLYYGGRGICGRGLPGWRWLDLRALATSLLPPTWAGASTRIVYCTARISGRDNPTGHAEQDVYLKALRASGSVDLIEYGNYVSRVKHAPLATPDKKGRPVLSASRWPVQVKDAAGAESPDATFMVSYAYREEKGSDVNVASHLLVDTLDGNIDGAIVISNDSDLRLTVQEVRARIPLGTVNPSASYLAGKLKGDPGDGVGGHWWRQLTDADFTGNQLTDPIGGYARPIGW